MKALRNFSAYRCCAMLFSALLLPSWKLYFFLAPPFSRSIKTFSRTVYEYKKLTKTAFRSFRIHQLIESVIHWKGWSTKAASTRMCHACREIIQNGYFNPDANILIAGCADARPNKPFICHIFSMKNINISPTFRFTSLRKSLAIHKKYFFSSSSAGS